MTLDVLIPTYNRAALLRRTLESLLAAEHPSSLPFAVTVCDNRSTDDTPAVVAEYQPRFGNRLHYLYEAVAGRSSALNAGIAATTGDLVAMIDDDEEVDRTWFSCIDLAFRDPATDFIGGPYVPRWTMSPPDWLPSRYGSVIGRADCGSEVRQYGPGFDGMLMGGNAVIRRRVLARVGPYRTDIGRTATRLMSCEDEDMFKKLLAAGLRGFYRPDLIIHHYVAPERVSKRYFRSWCFWRGVSLGILDHQQPEDVVYVLGVPRHMIGTAVRSTLDTVTRFFGPGARARRFANELAWWDLAGFVYGKHWQRPAAAANRAESVASISKGAPWTQA
jgi:glycosyltransferase involved in cell wall biosynthesis